VGDDLVAGAAVLERQTHACCQPLVYRELVVGLFVVGFRAIDEVPHVVAVDPPLGELVNKHFSVEQRHGYGVGDVHLGTDRLQRAHRLPTTVSVCCFRHVDIDPFDLVGLHLILEAQLQCGVDSSVQQAHGGIRLHGDPVGFPQGAKAGVDLAGIRMVALAKD
jgi:hypothetical protein